MVGRNIEFIFGLGGGILGILTVPLFIVFGLFAAIGGSTFMWLAGWAGLPVSILGLVGAGLVKNHPKIGGILMLLCGILGIFIALGLWVGALLLIIAGIVALRRKEKTTEPQTTPNTQQTFYCQNCGKPLTFMEQSQKWYCENCKTYPQIEKQST